MRVPKYLSPSSFKLFESNLDEFYVKYLAENRPPRMGQTKPMSVGSAFDAYAKSYIHYCLFGNYGPNDQYAEDTIFEQQVEAHNRDWARLAGQHTFNCYKNCGALADLMLELQKSVGKPRFEFEIQGTVESRIGNVPLLGKPDIFFMNQEGARVILDWKVNGYCANSMTSPMKGYVMVRDTWACGTRKAGTNNRMHHKDCFPSRFKGLMINTQEYLENLNTEWAAQLSVYAWLLGEEVGSQDLIQGIDQITGCGDSDASGFPYLRVASHRLRVGANYQHELLDRLTNAWNIIMSGHIFREMSREDSDERCAELERQSKAMSDPNDPMAGFINEISRG